MWIVGSILNNPSSGNICSGSLQEEVSLRHPFTPTPLYTSEPPRIALLCTRPDAGARCLQTNSRRGSEIATWGNLLIIDHWSLTILSYRIHIIQYININKISQYEYEYEHEKMHINISIKSSNHIKSFQVLSHHVESCCFRLRQIFSRHS